MEVATILDISSKVRCVLFCFFCCCFVFFGKTVIPDLCELHLNWIFELMDLIFKKKNMLRSVLVYFSSLFFLSFFFVLKI